MSATIVAGKLTANMLVSCYDYVWIFGVFSLLNIQFTVNSLINKDVLKTQKYNISLSV